jgi:hypothetical protein
MNSTVAWTELAFTIPAIIGLFINWWAFNDAVADLHYLHAKGLNGAREVVAKASCRNEAIRTAIQFMFMSLGIFLMMRAPANPETPTTLAGIAVSAVILTAEVLMVVKSILDRRDRHEVIRILAARKERD